MTPETRLANDIKRHITAMGGTWRKCEWAGRRGAPDLLIMLRGRHFWLELKAPEGRVAPLQEREHEIMRSVGGCAVYVVRSLAEAEAVINAQL